MSRDLRWTRRSCRDEATLLGRRQGARSAGGVQKRRWRAPSLWLAADVTCLCNLQPDLVLSGMYGKLGKYVGEGRG